MRPFRITLFNPSAEEGDVERPALLNHLYHGMFCEKEKEKKKKKKRNIDTRHVTCIVLHVASRHLETLSSAYSHAWSFT